MMILINRLLSLWSFCMLMASSKSISTLGANPSPNLNLSKNDQKSHSTPSPNPSPNLLNTKFAQIFHQIWSTPNIQTALFVPNRQRLNTKICRGQRMKRNWQNEKKTKKKLFLTKWRESFGAKMNKKTVFDKILTRIWLKRWFSIGRGVIKSSFWPNFYSNLSKNLV